MSDSRRLPPLHALRCFEAAARLGSFVGAAEELFVTPSAVSQQVKSLEDWLGVCLFRRLPRGLLLTDAGQAYLPPLREALDRIAQATQEVLKGNVSQVLTVSTLPSFAAQWLVPRLWRFNASHPEVDVRIAASIRLVDFFREDIDLAIRYGDGRYPGLHVEQLLTETIVPMCSPALRDGDPPLRSLADLARHTLLHDEVMTGQNEELTWEHWLRINANGQIECRRGPTFSDAHLTMQAAITGRGVALGRSVLARDALRDGRLVTPFADIEPLPTVFSYYLVCLPATLERPKVAEFRTWLLEEAANWTAENTD